MLRIYCYQLLIHVIIRKYAPFCNSSLTSFVTNPTGIWSHIRDNSVRLKLTDNLIPSNKVVKSLFTIRSFTISTVKPDFTYLTIISKKLNQLFYKEIIVLVCSIIF